jgi:hypothetical protein
MPSKDDLAALRLKLQRQRREIDEKLRAIELVESLLAGSDLAVALRQPELIISSETFPGPRAKYEGIGLGEACRDVLATQGEWCSTHKTTEAVMMGGFPFLSGTPRGSISTTLSRMEAKGEVERKRVGKENMWRLKG